MHQVDIADAYQTRSTHRVPNEKIFPVQHPLVIDIGLGILPTIVTYMGPLGRTSAQARMYDLRIVR